MTGEKAAGVAGAAEPATHAVAAVAATRKMRVFIQADPGTSASASQGPNGPFSLCFGPYSTRSRTRPSSAGSTDLPASGGLRRKLRPDATAADFHRGPEQLTGILPCETTERLGCRSLPFRLRPSL